MIRISTEAGEYDTWQLGDIFPRRLIQQLAEEHGLSSLKLSEVLDQVVAEFNDKAHFYYRLPIWHQAKEKALDVLPHLQEALKRWSYAPDRVKAALSENTLGDYSSDQLIVNLERMIASLTLVTEVKARERGERSNSTKKDLRPPIPDLQPIHGPTELLFRLWLDEKGERPGHEVEYGHPHEIDGEVVMVAKATSPGLRFIHACLVRLDDRITVEHCRNRIRHIKRQNRV